MEIKEVHLTVFFIYVFCEKVNRVMMYQRRPHRAHVVKFLSSGANELLPLAPLLVRELPTIRTNKNEVKRNGYVIFFGSDLLFFGTYTGDTCMTGSIILSLVVQ